MQSRLVIDPARATLRNLVEDVLKDQLEYGDEFSVNNEVGILYDPELDDNLSKKFSELGVKTDSFLTIVDEDDDNPRVNLSLSISEKYFGTSQRYGMILIFTLIEPFRKTRIPFK
jgi:ubiquitin-like 1-activating enzyme E1 B